MPASNHPNSASHLGRFVVKFQDATQSGLTAEQVMEILEKQRSEVLDIYRIHRVCDNGQMELVGVAAAMFKQRDCLLFSRAHVTDARRDYDAIVELGQRSSPPCRIKVQLSHAKQFTPSHIVALVFPAACSEAVGQWLIKNHYQAGDQTDGSPAVLTAYQATSPQVIKQHVLEAGPLDDGGTSGL